MNEDPSQAPDPSGERSVFGNLPSSRPGRRSPRRDSAVGARTAAEPEPVSATEAATPEDDAARVLAESRPSKERAPREPEAQPPEEEDDGGGLEELAWAGVAAAAEAATLGVRLANRALESLRGDSERS